jgi:hypothetical protein
VKPNPYTSCKCQTETQCIFNVEEPHVTLLILPVSCTPAILLTQLVYFTNTYCNQSALHCMKLLKHHGISELVLHLLRAVEVCNIREHRFFLLCFLHTCSNSICLERVFTPVQEASSLHRSPSLCCDCLCSRLAGTSAYCVVILKV